MKFQIMHETRNRMRLCALQRRMTERQADLLEAGLLALPGVEKVTVHARTCGVILTYRMARSALLQALAAFSYEKAEKQNLPVNSTGRQLNREYKEKIVFHIIRHYARRLFLPAAVRYVIHTVTALPYLWRAFQCLWRRKITVELLDGVAIGASLLTGDFETAGSVMFLLKLGDHLEEWTHKKSVDDLAQRMALNADAAWLRTEDGANVLVPLAQIGVGGCIVVDAGSVIPLDGEIEEGEVMVNQASLTGEAVPVARRPGATVYAGTVVEEGHCVVRVTRASGSGRYDQIVQMIEDSQKLRSGAEARAAGMADRLVPWTLGASLLTGLLTGDIQRAVAVLMVDFSCALKLSMPLSVLSAMREAGGFKITVKGGKYLEAISEAETLILDKTGTLTNACPTVAEVIPFNGTDPDEMLRIAACLEEHFPHSMANAVVRAAKERSLAHEEMHSEVEYVVAHGIVSKIDGSRVIIGSSHFAFEDEFVTLSEGDAARLDALPPEYSHLYLAIGGILSAVICISDPLRAEAREAVKLLHEAGFSRIVMLTGDSERTAAAIAREAGIDDYRAEVLPEDKARYIREEQARGRKVVMIGDGINDAPALSYADAGIAIGSGAAIAREVADITITAEDLRELARLKWLSDGLMRRIRRNYRFIMGFNGALIALGAIGVLPAATSALLHNVSTILLSLDCMTDLQPRAVPAGD